MSNKKLTYARKQSTTTSSACNGVDLGGKFGLISRIIDKFHDVVWE